MAAIIDILVLSSKGYFFNPGIALDCSEQVQSFSKGVQMTPVEAKLPEACGDTFCDGFSLIESLIFQHWEWNSHSDRIPSHFFCPGLFMLPDAFILPAAAHLSGASRWEMMRVRAHCAALDSFLIGVHLGSPAAMNACNTAAKPETSLSAFQQFLSCPAAATEAAARLWRRWVWLAVTAPSGVNGLVRWVNHGHFNNLAFFKSPLQSVRNHSPSQYIISCLLWTCLA